MKKAKRRLSWRVLSVVSPFLVIGFVYLLSGRSTAGNLMDESQAREIEELRAEVQELHIQLDQLIKSRDFCYNQVKRLEEEGRRSRGLFEQRLRHIEEEKEKSEQNLVSAREREKLLRNDLEQVRSQLYQLTEAREKEIQELSRLKVELVEKLKEHIAAGKILIREEKRGLAIALVDVAPLRSEGTIIRPEAKSVLHEISKILKKHPNREFLIEGHTDDEPITSSQFPSNWELSTDRATTILRYLEEKEGIPSKCLSAVGHGEYRPLATNTTPAGRKKNRRVEIVILAEEIPY